MKPRSASMRLKRIAIAALAGAAAIALAACSSGSSSNGSSAEPTSVNYQFSWLKITQFGGFFAAQKQGYFADEDIKPTLTAGGSNILAWQQVATGKALLGDEDNTLLLQAIQKGEPLVAIGAVFQKSPMAIMSLKSDPITSVQDMVGKTIAYPDNGIDQFKAVIKAAGVDPSKVDIVPAGSDPTQLITKQVDGYAGYATSQGAALEVKGVDINTLYVDDLGVGSYGNVIITTKKNLKDHRAEIVKFMTAVVKGYEYMNANPKSIADYVVGTVNPTGGLDKATEEKTAAIQKELIESPTGVLRLDATKMQKIIDSLKAAGTISKEIKATDVIDTSVLDDVYGDKTTLLK